MQARKEGRKEELSSNSIPPCQVEKRKDSKRKEKKRFELKELSENYV
jgi:hypothetical protein